MRDDLALARKHAKCAGQILGRITKELSGMIDHYMEDKERIMREGT